MHNESKCTIYTKKWSARLKIIGAMMLAIMLLTPINAISKGGGGKNGGHGSGGSGGSHSSEHGTSSDHDGHNGSDGENSADSESHGDKSPGGSGKKSGDSGNDKSSGSGSQSVASKSFRNKGHDTTSLSDDDSDRPDWAKGNKEVNPHRGVANPTPGTKKGDEYGDLYVVVRDPVTGDPILIDGELQICQDAECTPALVALTVDGEVPPDVTPIEVEFERLNIGRAPSKVLDHALEEALSKISSGAVLALDAAGRITVDGVTIDSPLENLALYLGIMGGDQTVLQALAPLDFENLIDIAPALLAGAASKTGEITIDLLYYSNQIYDIAQPNTSYNYESFDIYDRSFYNVDLNYFYMEGDTVTSALVNLQDYLQATQPAIVDESNNPLSGISLFSIAADDALEIVELIHTQIHDAELPGTITQ